MNPKMHLSPILSLISAYLLQISVNGFAMHRHCLTSCKVLRKDNRKNKLVGSKVVVAAGQRGIEEDSAEKSSDKITAATGTGTLVRRAFLLSSVLAGGQLMYAQAYAPSGFKRIPTQFIAALGDPTASSGSNANEWGIWRLDPGPRGVWLRQYSTVLEKNNVAPAGWKFDPKDWWVEEHGLIMESPSFPLPPGRYLVTGGRTTTAVLSVDQPTVTNGKEQQTWSLDSRAKLYDVTHLPCRSARYTPNASGNGSPLNAKLSDFPVSPGAEMPKVEGCDKQDYAVLFVIGVEDTLNEL